MPKNWSTVLSELERSIAIMDSVEDAKNLLSLFEPMVKDVREKSAREIYFKMWKVALKAGKLSLAKRYADIALEYLIELKRIPQIKIFIASLNEAGISKNKFDEYGAVEEILLGKRNNISNADLNKYSELFINHPDHWKQSKEFLKQYLLLDTDWNQDMWKLCYEFILINHFDKYIFLALLDKARELKNIEQEKKIAALLNSKNIKFSQVKSADKKEILTSTETLNVDYDQIAMDLLSGAIEPSHEEQIRVINSLKYITDEELSSKGQEMIVAFELLGMEQVVLCLCERVITLIADVRERASTYFVWVQALMNMEEYYKAIDLIDEVLQTEPLYGEERLAFIYLKAESCLKLKKLKMAKDLYLTIKKQNPNYRLVGERLKSFETVK